MDLTKGSVKGPLWSRA